MKPLFEDSGERANIRPRDVSQRTRNWEGSAALVRDAGFHWAWNDTCCINKHDNMIGLQESLVAMFTMVS
jgi:hypothetical protein